jgi:cell division protein FtsW (lipid II flippase)
MKNNQIHLFTLIINIGVMVFYSSEIEWMPHFNGRPDKVYLILPQLAFGLFYSIVFINSIYLLKKKQSNWKALGMVVCSFFLFLMLNNPKGNSQQLGFILIGVLNVVLAFIVIKR